MITLVRRTPLITFLVAVVVAHPFNGQTFEQEPVAVEVPDHVMEQVVRRILTWSFKPVRRPKIIYLADVQVEPSWLPHIRNVEFRLISIEAIEEKNLKVYFFTKPFVKNKVHVIDLAYGQPTCYSDGTSWSFRIRKRVRLWQNLGFGSGCGVAAASSDRDRSSDLSP
jgi:hypothetical protein